MPAMPLAVEEVRMLAGAADEEDVTLTIAPGSSRLGNLRASGRGRLALAAVATLLGAAVGATVILGVPLQRSSPASAQQKYQPATGENSASAVRVEEIRMAGAPGLNLDMTVRMIGVETKHGHVVGHLVKVMNPAGRVSFATPPGGCGTREKTSVTAKMHYPRCRLAINAGYFNVTNGACIGNLVTDSKVVQTVPLAQSNVNFGIRNGQFAIGYFHESELAGFEQLISGVVWLVRDGKRYVGEGWKEANTTVQTSGAKYSTNLASRTAVGWNAEGVMMVIQVDGSIAVGDKKRGLDMFELADLLIHHGAVNAINLDGGGSSAMVKDGVLINYPSDMRPPSCDPSGDFQCERPVSSILCVHELPGVIPNLPM